MDSGFRVVGIRDRAWGLFWLQITGTAREMLPNFTPK